MPRLTDKGAQARGGSVGRTLLSERRLTRKRSPKRSQAGRPTAAELERRKTKVMDVAIELFTTRGYAGTALVDIAKGAGVATRTLYQHFGDKESMFREVILARDTEAVPVRPVIEEEETLVSALNQIGNYACEIAFRPRSVALMRLMIAESNRFPDFMQRVATAIFTKFQMNVREAFAELADLGLIPEGDHAQSAAIFIDLMLGSAPIMNYMNWLAAPPSKQVIEGRVHLFVNGAFSPSGSRATRAHKARV